MNTPNTTGPMRPVIAAVRSVGVEPAAHTGQAAGAGAGVAPFVTISRQAGAGGWSLAQRLVDRLNHLSPEGPLWRAFDRELVEKVATDHHISKDLIESLGDTKRSWMEDLFAGLAVAQQEEFRTELAVYRRVAATIRALAHGGRVVIVGRGGVYITQNMPGGVHLRLVAPVEFRIAEMQRKFNLSRAAASLRVRQLDHNRHAFYRRYWPRELLRPEVFTLTINSAKVNEDGMIETVLPVVPAIAGEARPAATKSYTSGQPLYPTYED